MKWQGEMVGDLIWNTYLSLTQPTSLTMLVIENWKGKLCARSSSCTMNIRYKKGKKENKHLETRRKMSRQILTGSLDIYFLGFSDATSTKNHIRMPNHTSNKKRLA